MKNFIGTFLGAFLSTLSMAQTDDELAVIKTCLTEYKFNAQKDDFFTDQGEKVNINKAELVWVNGVLTALIWTFIGDKSDYSTKYDITLSILKEKKGKYELVSQTNVVEGISMVNVFSTTTETISSTVEALSVKYGSDTDGDGDDIKFTLFTITADGAELILDHTLVDDSGDGCDVNRMESEIILTDETTNEYFNFQVVENTSTSNSCEENEEESCTKKRTYKYTWNGSQYVTGN